VGVNLTNEPWMEPLNPFFFREVALALDKLCLELRAHIVFFDNEVRDMRPFDRAAARKCAALMKCSANISILPRRYRTPLEMMSLIGVCSITVGMRYHFCLFSAIRGVPFVGIERSDKTADLFGELNWEHRMPLEKVTGERLSDMCERLVSERESASNKLRVAAVKMKERAKANRDVIGGLIG
jgi:polysaccharide pyruvyl transferase WcaK-like protein